MIKTKIKIRSIIISLIIVIISASVITYFQARENAIRQEEILIATSIFDLVDISHISLAEYYYSPNSVSGNHTFPLTGDIDFAEKNLNATQNTHEINSFSEIIPSINSLENADILLTSGEDVIFDGMSKDFTAEDVSHITQYNLAVTMPINHIVESENSQGEIFATATYDIDIKFLPKITVGTDKSMYMQGEMIVLTVTGFEEAVVNTNLMHGVNLYEYDEAYIGFVPIDVTQETGAYYIEVVRGTESARIDFTISSREYEVQYLTVEPDVVATTVGNTEEALRYRNTLAEVLAVADDELYITEPFISPVQGYITTEFATQRYDLGSTTPRWHNAIDIGGNAIGTPVIASNAGRIVMSDFFANTGNTIIIEHGFGLKTIYMHLDERYVNVGDMVQIGESIGTIGNTGYSTGAHLHFGVIANGVEVNPLHEYE